MRMQAGHRHDATLPYPRSSAPPADPVNWLSSSVHGAHQPQFQDGSPAPQSSSGVGDGSLRHSLAIEQAPSTVSQAWPSQGPAPSAPSVGQISPSTYPTQSYGPMSGAHQPAANHGVPYPSSGDLAPGASSKNAGDGQTQREWPRAGEPLPGRFPVPPDQRLNDSAQQLLPQAWPQSQPAQLAPSQAKPPLPPRPMSAVGHGGYSATNYGAADLSHDTRPGPFNTIHYAPPPHGPSRLSFAPDAGFQPALQSLGISHSQPSYQASPSHRPNYQSQVSPEQRFAPIPSHNQIPPMPPPMPYSYQAELRNNHQPGVHHLLYSQGPPSHRYEPHAQPSLQQPYGPLHSVGLQPRFFDQQPRPPPDIALSGNLVPPPPPPKLPESSYFQANAHALQYHQEAKHLTSSISRSSPEGMSLANAWTASVSQPEHSYALPYPQSSLPDPRTNTNWTLSPGLNVTGTSQMYRGHVPVSAEPRADLASSSLTFDPTQTSLNEAKNVQHHQPQGWQQPLGRHHTQLQESPYRPQPITQEPRPFSDPQLYSQNVNAERNGQMGQPWHGQQQTGYDNYHTTYQNPSDTRNVVRPQEDRQATSPQYRAGMPSAILQGSLPHDAVYGIPSSQSDEHSQALPLRRSQNEIPQIRDPPDVPSTIFAEGATQSGSNPILDLSSSQARHNKSQPPQVERILADESPLESSASGLGASVLGAVGGPSDWEHFGVTPIDSDDETPEEDNLPRADPKALSFNGVAELASNSPSTPASAHTIEDQLNALGNQLTSITLIPQDLHPLHDAIQRPADITTEQSDERYLPTPPPINEPPRSSARTESDVSVISLAQHDRTGQSIDQAIQAWTQPASQGTSVKPNRVNSPLKHGLNSSAENRASPNEVQGPHPTMEHPINRSPKVTPLQDRAEKQLENREQGPVGHSPPQDPKGVTRFPEGFAVHAADEQIAQDDMAGQSPDLDGWHKESLDRYAAMLRKESQATSGEKKLKVFRDFLTQESQLRGVPYDLAQGSQHEAFLVASSLAHENTEQPVSEEGQSINMLRSSSASTLRSLQVHLPGSAYSQKDDDEQYSPGGRPLLRPSYKVQARNSTKTVESDPKVLQQISPIPLRMASEPDSPGRNAPIAIETPTASANQSYTKQLDPSTSRPRANSDSQPLQYRTSMYNGQSSESMHSEYKSYDPPPTMRHNDNNGTTNGMPVDSHPNGEQISSYKSFSLQGRPRASTTNSEPVVSIQKASGYGEVGRSNYSRSCILKREPEELVLAEEYYRTNDSANSDTQLNPASFHPAINSQITNPVMSGEGLRQTDISELAASLKKVLLNDSHSTRRRSPSTDYYITNAVKILSEDFTFIERYFRTWDAEAKKIRQKHFDERQQRQEEQEAHTDRLFVENQIGYGDINTIEEGYKRSELERKAQEDEQEYKDYAQNVFDPIYKRLQEQIKELMEQYISCMDAMSTPVSERGLPEEHNGEPDYAQMNMLLLELHNGIEMRQEKVLRAVMERDRRYKKTVLQPLYAAGGIQEMKQLEKHFEEAEMKTILDAAVKAEERANKLSHFMEKNTTRVVSEEVAYLKLVNHELWRIAQSLSENRTLQLSDRKATLQSELGFAHEVLQQMPEMFETLLRSSHDAAVLLSEVQFDVSHASAKLSHADSETLEQLEEDKIKREHQLGQKLNDHLPRLLQEVREGVDLIDGILAPNGHPLGNPHQN